MKVETKYSVGDVFYCPRSYMRTRTIVQEFEGYEWERMEDYLTPEVKMLRIRNIRVEVDADLFNTVVRYSCDVKRDIADEWKNESFLRSYTDVDLDRAYDNYDQAFEKAQEYAIHKKREYLG